MARSPKPRSKSRPRTAKRVSRAAKAATSGRGKRPAVRSKPPRAAARKASAKAPSKASRTARSAARKPARKVSTGLSRANAAVLSRADARAEVDGLLSRLPPPVVPITKALRQLVREAAPEVVERIQGGDAAYFAGGMFARIEPHEREVLVTFLRGAQLPSSVVLKTDGKVGSVALSSLDSVRASVLRTLVREAVLLNLEAPASKPRA